jgi:hypothetical protein
MLTAGNVSGEQAGHMRSLVGGYDADRRRRFLRIRPERLLNARIG